MEKVLKYLPVLSGLLVLIGYLNYSTFYKCFDIDISTYLTTGELLLSFLPLTIPILALFLFFFLGIVATIAGRALSKGNDSKAIVEDPDDSIISMRLFYNSLKLLINKFRNKELKKPFWFLLLPIDLISISLGLAYIIFFPSFIVLLFRNVISIDKEILLPTPIFIFLAIFWIILLFSLFEKKPENHNDNFNSLKLVVLLTVFVAINTIVNKSTAYQINHGNPKYKVAIELGEKNVMTDSTLVYIGKTKEFLFIRDLQNKSNIIYPISEIKKLEIKKN